MDKVFFHQPIFNRGEDKHVIEDDSVALKGFRADVDAIHVFIIQQRQWEAFQEYYEPNGAIVGFDYSTEEINGDDDETAEGSEEDDDYEPDTKLGIALHCTFGKIYNDYNGTYFYPGRISREAGQIMTVLRISNKGKKKSIQWIADGNEGPIEDCTDEFDNATMIYPSVRLHGDGQEHRSVPMSKLKHRSTMSDRLIRASAKVEVEDANKKKEEQFQAQLDAKDEEIKQLKNQLQKQNQQKQQTSEAKNKNDKELKEKEKEIKQKSKALEQSEKKLEAEKEKHLKSKEQIKKLQEELKKVKKESGQRRKRE